MSDNAFDLLAEPMRHCLWRMGWTELRPIQADAIRTILRTDQDLIISARTAAGKTEAAFLPVLSRFVEQPPTSVGAVYVSPLKALINDQFRRLEELCEHVQVPVHRWHGDVSDSAKRKLIEAPGGVLLITPESLESLFCNRSNALDRVFADLRFVVIDELHAFVGRERGLHLRSLLHRLEARVAKPFRIVALSATLGEWTADYAGWIRHDEQHRVSILSDSSGAKSLRFKIYGFTRAATRQVPDGGSTENGGPEPAMLDEMLKAFEGRRNLIFANRRSDVELFADGLNNRSRHAGLRPQFMVHHGSVSKEIREDAEAAMREGTPCTTVCSSTLELGIDIGNVDAIGQVGPPWSVNSLVQRLGRSGRKPGQASVMRMYLEEDPPNANDDLIDRLHLDLIQSIAMTELMLERWIERPDCNAYDLSTLIQQILSVLKETGGSRAAAIFDRLVTRGAFHFVDQSTFAAVLRSIGKQDLIEQTVDGELILGLRGEEIVKSFDFYSVFESSKEYSVLCDGRLVGTLPAVDPPKSGEYLLLGGRRWIVDVVDSNRHEIVVSPARGKKAPKFKGAAADMHPKVIQKMHEVLLGDKSVPYLNSQSSDWLGHARQAAAEAHLSRVVWHELSSRSCLAFIWRGTRVQRTLSLLARVAGVSATDCCVALQFSEGLKTVTTRLAEIRHRNLEASELARHALELRQRKYDDYLSKDLLVACYAMDAIDCEGARLALDSLLAGDSSDRAEK